MECGFDWSRSKGELLLWWVDGWVEHCHPGGFVGSRFEGGEDEENEEINAGEDISDLLLLSGRSPTSNGDDTFLFHILCYFKRIPQKWPQKWPQKTLCSPSMSSSFLGTPPCWATRSPPSNSPPCTQLIVGKNSRKGAEVDLKVSSPWNSGPHYICQIVAGTLRTSATNTGWVKRTSPESYWNDALLHQVWIKNLPPFVLKDSRVEASHDNLKCTIMKKIMVGCDSTSVVYMFVTTSRLGRP